MKIHIEVDSLDDLRDVLAGLRVYPVVPGQTLPQQGAPVDELELSIRTQNILKGEGIETIDKLMAYGERQLFLLPSMGRKSLNEIKECLASRGMALSP